MVSQRDVEQVDGSASCVLLDPSLVHRELLPASGKIAHRINRPAVCL